jgi:aspartate-semialdehyde dehydrogenase
MNADRLRRTPNVGIVGSSSLLGKELKEILEDGGFPLGRLVLLETEEYAGLLQEFAGDLKITQIISPESLADVDISFFTCSPEIMRAYIESGAAFPELTIDLTQSGREGRLFLSGISDPSILESRGYFINPHPATIVIARVLSRLEKSFGLRLAAVTVLQPASERGNAGVEELQEQTVTLLNFQNIEKKVFAGQLSFNILPEAASSRRTEDQIVAQLATLMGRSITMPMVNAIQAPVFHGHGFSLFVQLNGAPTVEVMREAFAGDSAFIVADDGGDGPSPVGVTGTHGIHVGRIHGFSDPGSFAMWLVADNLRIAASSAIRTAENIMLAVIGRS